MQQRTHSRLHARYNNRVRITRDMFPFWKRDTIRKAKVADRRQAAKAIDCDLMLDGSCVHEFKACINALSSVPWMPRDSFAHEPYDCTADDLGDPDEYDMDKHDTPTDYVRPDYAQGVWIQVGGFVRLDHGHHHTQHITSWRYIPADNVGAWVYVQWDSAEQEWIVTPSDIADTHIVYDHTHTLEQMQVLALTMYRMGVAA